MQVVDLITSALHLINVLASGETVDAATANDALFVFQGMIDSWNAESLMIFTDTRLVFPLTVGQQAYTYGIGGDFNSPRPAAIDRMSIMWLGNPAQPLELPMAYLTTAEWQAIPVKNIQSSLAQYCWDDGGFPFRTLSFWPIPNALNNVVIYPWVALAAPATLQTQLSFPPGYQQALRYNLAALLAAEFPPVPAEIMQMVVAIAMQSKAVIKAMNQPIIDLRCDPALNARGGGLYDWRSDTVVGRR